MKNKTRSFLLLVCLPVLMLVMLSPAYAITTTIKPSAAIVNSTSDAYTATLEPTGGPSAGFFFLNITIPTRYNLTLPAAGRTVGNYTMLNKTTGVNKVIINITSANPDTDLVNVIFSTDGGVTYSTTYNQNISNMSIGASTLNITKPTASTAGYFNLSLGGTAGPIDPTHNNVTITLANGTLRNPDTASSYTWYLEAKNSPTETAFPSSNVVNIQAGASQAVTIPTFNATIPANASLALPNGSLTVNITAAAGVNVTNLVVTLRNFTSDPNSSATAGASGLERLLFIGVDAPALSGVLFTAFLRVNYSSKLSSLTTPEANLRLYRFNDASSAWEITTNSGVDISNTTVYGTTTAFSTFAIMGAAAAAAAAAPAAGGGGGGGGGVTSGEPLVNIEKREIREEYLRKDVSASYTFTTPEIPVRELLITANINAGSTNAQIELLKDTSKLVTQPAPGIVYKNINIWVGTSGFATPKNIKEAIIKFRIENSWLGGNNVAGSDVKMVKWDGSKWVQIETTEKTKDGTFTYYEAKTDSFSSFAITGLKGVVVPTATPAIEVTETPPTETPAPTPIEKAVGFKDILSITTVVLGVIIIILAAVYLFKRKRG